MNAKELLQKSKKRGVHLFVPPNGCLGFEGPQHAIEEMGPELKEHKAEIIAMIFDYQGEVDQCVADFNRGGICLMDYPEEIRHKSLMLEKAFTEAAMAKDRSKFLDLLEEWRGCFNTCSEGDQDQMGHPSSLP